MKCDGTHSHQRLTQGRASRAACYPQELCDAICEGLVSHLAHQKIKELEEDRAKKEAEDNSCSVSHVPGYITEVVPETKETLEEQECHKICQKSWRIYSGLGMRGLFMGCL